MYWMRMQCHSPRFLDKSSLRRPRRRCSLFIAAPGKLKDKYSFLSAMDAEVLRDGQYVYTLDTSMIVDFVIPDDQQKANLVILHWEGSKWVEVPGGCVTNDGYFEASTYLTGIFILATK
jgi:hypothetical protein